MYRVTYHTSMKAAYLVEMDYKRLFPDKEIHIRHINGSPICSVIIHLNEAGLALHKLAFPGYPFIIHEYEGDDHER